MKLDVQGSELSVLRLRGARRTLRRTAALSFEVAHRHLAAHNASAQLLAAEVAAAGFRLRESWDRTGGDWVGVRDPQ